jgi:hypothetical protein
MRSFRPPRGGSSPAALPALLRASHLLGLAFGSALGKLRDSGVTTAGARQFAEREQDDEPRAAGPMTLIPEE